MMIQKRDIFSFLMGMGICRYFSNEVYKQKDRTIERQNITIDLLDRWLNLRDKEIYIGKYLERQNYKKVAIYGLGMIGNHLYEELITTKLEIIGIDRTDIYNNYQMTVYKPDDSFEDVDLIIVTPMGYEEIKSVLRKKYRGRIVSFMDLLSECEMLLYSREQ